MPNLSVVPPREHPLSDQLTGLAPSVLGILREVLEQRHHQDAKFGRHGHHPLVWSAIIDEWKGKLAKSARLDDRSNLRHRGIQIAALGIAMAELGFDGEVSAELLAELAGDAGLDEEDWALEGGDLESGLDAAMAGEPHWETLSEATPESLERHGL